MVVHQIDIPSVTCLKPEDQTPIARDGKAPEAAPIAPEWMQTPSGKHRHVCNLRGMGKGKSIRLIFGAIAGDTPRGVSFTNKRSKPRCRKFRIAISHSVLCNVTLCNYFQLVLIFSRWREIGPE
jgi:hypothetical protein